MTYATMGKISESFRRGRLLLAAEFDTLGAINEGRQGFPAGPLFKKRRHPPFGGADAAGDGRKKRVPAAASFYAAPERADTGPVPGQEANAAEITEKRGFL